MNKKITTYHDLRHAKSFRVFFKPDPTQDMFIVGRNFYIVSVNRQTGEVKFSSDHSGYNIPKEESDE